MKRSVMAMAARGWRFWMAWAAAFVGFPLGGVAAAVVVGAITTPLTGAVGGGITGAIIGVAQWLVLRRRLPITPTWIGATALGMGMGLALSIALFGTDVQGLALPLRALITGGDIGVAQYLLLRGSVSRAPIWTLVVAVSWTLGWWITCAIGVDLTFQWSVFGSSGAVLFQLMTGLTLAWLVQTHTTPRDSHQSGWAAYEPRTGASSCLSDPWR